MSKPTPNDDHQPNDTRTPNKDQTIQIGSNAEREKVRYLIARKWRRNGHHNWTAGQMERAIDAVILKRRSDDIERRSTERSATQTALFESGESSQETGTAGHRYASNRRPETRR